MNKYCSSHRIKSTSTFFLCVIVHVLPPAKERGRRACVRLRTNRQDQHQRQRTITEHKIQNIRRLRYQRRRLRWSSCIRARLKKTTTGGPALVNPNRRTFIGFDLCRTRALYCVCMQFGLVDLLCVLLVSTCGTEVVANAGLLKHEGKITQWHPHCCGLATPRFLHRSSEV